MMSDYGDKIRLFFLIAYLIFAVGTVAGSIYYVNYCNSLGDIKNILNTYVDSIKTGLDSKNIIVNTLKDNITLFLLLLICIFFRIGIFLSVFIVIRKGFITGFTVASIIGAYGVKGIFVALISALQYLIIIPVMLFFCAVNTLFSARILERERKNIIFYIFFSIIILSIFCVESLIEGTFSTTFMKWLLNTVT